jgi:hypothetical protein
MILSVQYEDTDRRIAKKGVEFDQTDTSTRNIADKQTVDLLIEKSKGESELTHQKFDEMLSEAKKRMENGLRLCTNLPEHLVDPQKNQWGATSNSNGVKMEATVAPLVGGSINLIQLYKVYISVSSSSDIPLTDGTPVLFALHSTYSNPFRLVTVEKGTANLQLLVYGSFTVGAFVGDTNHPLEYDLATIPNAPRGFIEN